MHISWQKTNNNAKKKKKSATKKCMVKKKYRTIKQISAWHHFGIHYSEKKKIGNIQLNIPIEPTQINYLVYASS